MATMNYDSHTEYGNDDDDEVDDYDDDDDRVVRLVHDNRQNKISKWIFRETSSRIRRNYIVYS